MFERNLNDIEIQTEELCKEVMSQSVGKYVLDYVEKLDFKSIAENNAIRILEEVQKIIIDENISETQKVLSIEAVFLNHGLTASGLYD